MATYTIQRGDTLGTIAAKTLGNAARYKEILAVNPQVTNPNLIKVGQVLQLPAAAKPAATKAPITTTATKTMTPSTSNLPVVTSAPQKSLVFDQPGETTSYGQSTTIMEKIKNLMQNKTLMLALAAGLVAFLMMKKKKKLAH
jgi:Tfp pilus assembly protein FimV